LPERRSTAGALVLTAALLLASHAQADPSAVGNQRALWLIALGQRGWQAEAEVAAGGETEVQSERTAGEVAAEVVGIDIRIADLLAEGSELAGVAPRAATSGIGSDVERDLFADGPPSGPPEVEQAAEQLLY